ncbi:9242_t:CDS:2 [Paraglomus brasilianum]|uniref:9242_t:CDS:1 n=1 Tax=Paraglomus brasilianum TaxID=144538 RepID=A0A9N8WHR8_9GLOM|nr:9242_t:CDS:2 [Paraglomus brasilianum]
MSSYPARYRNNSRLAKHGDDGYGTTHYSQLMDCENRTCKERQKTLSRLEDENKKKAEELNNCFKELTKAKDQKVHQDNLIKDLQQKLDQQKRKCASLQNSNKMLAQQSQQIKNDSETKVEELSNELNEKNLEIQNIKDSHSEFRQQALQWRKEASELQAALGDFGNAELADENPNNTTNFEGEITELKHIVSQVCLVELANSVNEKASASLLEHRAYTKNRAERRGLLSCLLQKHIIQYILKLWDESLEKYTQRGIGEDFDFVHLENSAAKTWASAPIKKFFVTYVKPVAQSNRASETAPFPHEYDDIMSMTAHAMQYFDGLEKALNEVDKNREDAQKLITKIRQLLLPCLSSKVCTPQNPTIQNITTSVLKRLREYRTIKDSNYLNDEVNLVRQLVPKCIKLLGIQFKIYYPKANLKWYECKEVLEGEARTWIDIDGGDNGSMVDICMFPLVYAGDHNQPERVYAKAKITVI